jgi:hypothetical protein
VTAAYALQADNDLREREREAREAIEHEAWHQQRLNDEFELDQAKMRCLSEAHERRLAAQEFLERERREQGQQERADALLTISKGPL